MEQVERIFPSAEELSKINTNLNCPQCPSVFNSETNLNLHLAKTHKMPHLLQPSSNNLKKIFHCPVISCNYNKIGHFKQFKFLKQHYLKVHAEKNYVCSLCKKGFSTESVRNKHVEYCDVIFKCCDCDAFYPCYETLKTHSRRKKHAILEKFKYKQSNALKAPKSETLLATSTLKLLLPKVSCSWNKIVISDKSEQGSQTEANMNQNNQQTQTLLATRIPQLTVETQTIGDYYQTKKPETLNTNLKNIKTQTVMADPKTVSCNTTFNLDEGEFIERNSSSTQTAVQESTYLYSASTSTHDSIHTDTSDLLTDTLDSNFFNCNIETQTDFMLDTDFFKYCDDYSNMYTQTCQDLLLGEIGLNNIQTQTVFDDLKSVESQTTMTQYKLLSLNSKNNVTHTKTQTDAHFKQILEEINA